MKTRTLYYLCYEDKLLIFDAMHLENMTLKDLSQVFNCSIAYLSKVFNGERPISEVRLLKLQEILNICLI